MSDVAEGVDKKLEITEPSRLVTNVTQPRLTIYRPDKEKDTGTAVLICPEAVTGTSTGRSKARKSRTG